MADLDSNLKRASSVGIMLFSILGGPTPDHSIGPGDRRDIAVSYAGSAAEVSDPIGPVHPLFGTFVTTIPLIGTFATTAPLSGTFSSSKPLEGTF